MKELHTAEKGFVTLIPVLVVVALFVLSLTVANFRKNRIIPAVDTTSVLSESSGSSGSDDGESSGSSSGSGSNEVETSSHESLTENRNDNENENENENVNEEEDENDREPEQEREREQEQEMEFEVEEEGESGKVKIKVSSEAGVFRFREIEFEAESHFPLSVDQKTNELTVDTPAGLKVVAVFPDQAVRNMLASGTISEVSQDRLTLRNQIKLALDENGNLFYEINGVKYEKLFGIFNVLVNKTGQVSAEDGQIITVNQSLFSKLLDLISV